MRRGGSVARAIGRPPRKCWRCRMFRACLKIAFGVPPLGGTAPEPPKGGTPNLKLRICVGFFRRALRGRIQERTEMNRLTTLVICMLAATASSQEWAKARLEKSPRHLEWVKVKHGDREVNCFIAYPEVKDKATAMVVIHEIFGLSDWVRGVADQLAEAGYIAIAPDLLSGMAPGGGGGTKEIGDRDAVTRAVRALPPAQVTADLNAVAEYVSKLPAANGKVTVSGFCWGGAQSFRYATDNANLKAAFVFYG